VVDCPTGAVVTGLDAVSPPAVDDAVVVGDPPVAGDDVTGTGIGVVAVVVVFVVVGGVAVGVDDPVPGGLAGDSPAAVSSGDGSATGDGDAVVVDPIDGTDEGEAVDVPPLSPVVGRADGSADFPAVDVDSPAPVSATATPWPANSAAPIPTAAAPERIHTVIECVCASPVRRSRDRRADFAARALAFARFCTR
jgi:hypothetical protein